MADFIDCHAHIESKYFPSTSEKIKECHENGIKKIITVGYDLASSQEAKKVAEENENTFFCAGFQPNELKEYSKIALAEIEKLLSHPRCVAVGEIGLDYHYDNTDKPLQKRAFVEQLELAHSNKKPIQIHSRDCAEDMVNILKENKRFLSYGCVMHCYSHSKEVAKILLDLGIYLSFTGVITYKNAKKTLESVALTPMDRITSETDSPYLSPEPVRGTKNSPMNIPFIVKKMAEVKGVDVEEMAQNIWNNAHTLYNLN